LHLTGADAANFLQGQFTNDLKQPGAVYGLWLNLKGKVLADSFVLRGALADEFWVGSYFSLAATIKERLESHIIADDVTVEDRTGEWRGVSLFGAPPEEQPKDYFVFRGRRGREAREEATEWVFPVTEFASVKSRLAGVTEWDANELARRRIEAGIASVPADAGPSDLPNEAGLEADAISYTKGCYLGQEVMARLKSMGQVRRRLRRVRGAGELPAKLPAALFVGARQVGELRSAAREADGRFVGLAMISLLHVPADGRLSFAADSVASAVQLLDAP
jgi:folate-binding protein YgfZ